MIRINLLPVSESDKIEDGKQIFTLFFVLVALVSLVCFYLQTQTQEELQSKQQVLNKLKIDLNNY